MSRRRRTCGSDGGPRRSPLGRRSSAPSRSRRRCARTPKPKLVAVLVHAETSTGAWQPLEDIGRLAREHDALFLVDCVTSLGGAPVDIDAMGIDAAYSGTQKCLCCPPGLSPGHLRTARARRHGAAEDQGAELVPRPRAARRNTGGPSASIITPRPISHELRPARVPPPGARGGPRGALRPPPPQPSTPSRPVSTPSACPSPARRAIGSRC